MKKENKKEINVKTKEKKAKIAVISICTILILFLGLQVYASTNGYGNVFFMIKNLITTGTISGEEEIFLDKDITLSYKSIELAEGLKLQANRLEIKEGKTNLYLSIKSQDGEVLPLKYAVTTKNSEGTEVTTKKNITGTKPQDADNFSYEDILKLYYEVDESKIIILKVSDSNDKELRTLEINLATREITVKGEASVEKISKIELRKYLDLFSELNNEINESDILLYIAQKIQENSSELIEKEDLEQAKITLTDRALKNAIIKEFYGDKAEFEFVQNSNLGAKGENGPDVEVLKGITAWEFNKENDEYKELTEGAEYRHGHCLKIEDISYKDGIYTVKYIYVLATGYEEDDDKLEDLPQYETTIKLKRDNEQIYSKYQIVSIEEGTVTKSKVSTEIEENDKEDYIFVKENIDDNKKSNTINTTNIISSNDTVSNRNGNSSSEYTGRFQEKLDWDVAQKLFETKIFANSGLVQKAMIEYKDFSNEEFSDAEILRILPELDVVDYKNQKMAYTQDGKYVASAEDIQQLSKKYFGRELNLEQFQKNNGNKIIIGDQINANCEYRLLDAYYLGQDYIFVFEYRNTGVKNTQTKIYGVRVECFGQNGDTEYVVYKGITDNIEGEVREYEATH